LKRLEPHMFLLFPDTILFRIYIIILLQNRPKSWPKDSLFHLFLKLVQIYFLLADNISIYFFINWNGGDWSQPTAYQMYVTFIIIFIINFTELHIDSNLSSVSEQKQYNYIYRV